MQSSRLSSFASSNGGATLTWLLRLLVGGTFIFSGFVKGIDPWGTLYKFEEYVAALGIPMLHSLLVAGVFGLCALEFLTGVFLVMGCYRRSAPMLAMAFMTVMLPLTLWIAVSDPVKDCGCFGDAFIISNWATFWKNVALTLMTVWLVRFNDRAVTLISPAFQWLGVVVSLAFIGYVSCYGYMRQPFLDFRAYPVGEPVADAGETSEGRYVFIYEKDGVRKEYGEEDELPSEDDGWTFVERREADGSTDENGADKTFRIWSEDGESDLTDVALGSERTLMLLIPDLASVSPATTWKINSLYDWSESKGIDMLAVVSGDQDRIDVWKDMSMPEYDIYTSDDTAIKEVARGNPALVYLENDTVRWKSTLSAVDTDCITAASDPSAIMEPAVDGPRELANWSMLYIAALATLVAISMVPRLRNMFGTRRRRDANPDGGAEAMHDISASPETTRDDKAPRAE